MGLFVVRGTACTTSTARMTVTLVTRIVVTVSVGTDQFLKSLYCDRWIQYVINPDSQTPSPSTPVPTVPAVNLCDLILAINNGHLDVLVTCSFVSLWRFWACFIVCFALGSHQVALGLTPGYVHSGITAGGLEGPYGGFLDSNWVCHV